MLHDVGTCRRQLLYSPSEYCGCRGDTVHMLQSQATLALGACRLLVAPAAVQPYHSDTVLLVTDVAGSHFVAMLVTQHCKAGSHCVAVLVTQSCEVGSHCVAMCKYRVQRVTLLVTLCTHTAAADNTVHWGCEGEPCCMAAMARHLPASAAAAWCDFLNCAAGCGSIGCRRLHLR